MKSPVKTIVSRTTKNRVAAALLAISCSAGAQEQGIPQQQMQQLMQSQMQMMVPMMGQMMQTMMRTQFEMLAQPETAKLLAAFTRNYYQALIDAGFSIDEAYQITVNTGIPSAPTKSETVSIRHLPRAT